jgi:hypothetical protein
MLFYKWHHAQFFFWKLRKPVVDINNVATCLIVMYLCNYSGLWEERYIYIPNSSNLLLNLVIFILYKESYIFGDKEDQIIWYFIIVFI